MFSIDDAHIFHRGPLGFLPFVVAGLYCVFLVYILIKRSNKKSIEIIPIVFLCFALFSGLVLPFVYGAYNQIFALGDIEFLDTGFTPLSAEAKTDVFSAAIYLEQCKDALLNELKFLRCLCIGFAQKLQSAITDSNRSSLRERVAHFLRLAEPGQPITDIARIAKSLNVSNRHLLRILKEYCNAGVLEHEKKGVYRLVHKP